MDDGEVIDNLRCSWTTKPEDVLGPHIVSKEKPPLAVISTPAAQPHRINEACGKSAPNTTRLTTVSWNPGAKRSDKTGLAERIAGPFHTVTLQDGSSYLNEPISQQFHVMYHPEKNGDSLEHPSKHLTLP